MAKNKKLARFQGNNCQGCWYAKSEMVGTGKPCCVYPLMPVVKDFHCYSHLKRPAVAVVRRETELHHFPPLGKREDKCRDEKV